MAVQFPYGFNITSNEPIDSRVVLTAAQLKTAHLDLAMPDKYVVICSSDDKLYIYDKNNSVDVVTGKFRVLKNITPISDDNTIAITVDPLDDTKYTISIKDKDSAVSEAVLRKHISTDNIVTYTWDEVYSKKQSLTLLNRKVDKETNKSLISQTDLDKLTAISANATHTGASTINGNITIDGIETPVYTAPAHIVIDANYSHIDNNYTSAEKSKLLTIATGAQVNTVSDVQLSKNGTSYESVLDNKIAKIDISSKQDIINSDNKLSFGYIKETNNRKFYSNAEKIKLAGIEENANVNKVEDILVNGASVVTNKTVDFSVKSVLAEDSESLATITGIRNFVNSSIQSNAANYVTKDATGSIFSTKADLFSTSIFYCNGIIYAPKKNDYAHVIMDEAHENKQSRYINTSETGVHWVFQFTLGSTFTAAQQQAIDSGITASCVTKLSGIYPEATKTMVFPKTGMIQINNTVSQLIPDNTVIDANYNHITITNNSVSDGNITFTKYDDTEIKSQIAEAKTELNTKINDLASDTEEAVEILNTNITTETTRATTAETTLSNRVDSLEARGRYLAQWDATIGFPVTELSPIPYYYRAGDYYIVSKAWTKDELSESKINKRPYGLFYSGKGSTGTNTEEFSELGINDSYVFTGEKWLLIQNSWHSIDFSAISGNAVDNSSLATELNKKQNKISELAKLPADYIEDGSINKVFTSANRVKLNSVETGAEKNKISLISIDNIPQPIVSGQINLNLSDYYVQKVENSRLISDTEAAKLATIENEAQKNIIENIKLNGTSISVTNKVVDIPITASTLENIGLAAIPTTAASNKILKSGSASTDAYYWGDNTVDADFTTDIAVGNLAAGTQITSDMTIKDILFTILCKLKLSSIVISGIGESTFKKEYFVGEAFDLSSIKITAKYYDETTKVISATNPNLTVTPSTIGATTNSVTIGYTEGGATKTAVVSYDFTHNSSVSGNCVNCSTSGTTSKTINITKAYWSDELLPSTGYTLENADLVITEGNSEETIWKVKKTDVGAGYKVKIENIKNSPLVYTVSAKQIMHQLTKNISNGYLYESISECNELSEYVVHICANEYYLLPDSVTLTNATLIHYDTTNGELIFKATGAGDIIITAACRLSSIQEFAIDVSNMKVNYKVGDTLALSNLITYIKYTSGQEEHILYNGQPETGEIIYPSTYTFVNTDVGQKQFTVSYKVSGTIVASNTFTVQVELKEIKTVTIVNIKNPYNISDNIYTGLNIICTYIDDTTEDVTNLCTLNHTSLIWAAGQNLIAIYNNVASEPRAINISATISGTAENCTIVTPSSSVTPDTSTYESVLTVSSGYAIVPSSLSITGTYTSAIISNTSIKILGISSNLTYTITPISAETEYTLLDGGVMNGTASGDDPWKVGVSGIITILPNSGYVLPTTVTAANIEGATFIDYNAITGKINISNIISNVKLKNIECQSSSSVVQFKFGGTGVRTNLDTMYPNNSYYQEQGWLDTDISNLTAIEIPKAAFISEQTEVTITINTTHASESTLGSYVGQFVSFYVPSGYQLADIKQNEISVISTFNTMTYANGLLYYSSNYTQKGKTIKYKVLGKVGE